MRKRIKSKQTVVRKTFKASGDVSYIIDKALTQLDTLVDFMREVVYGNELPFLIDTRNKRFKRCGYLGVLTTTIPPVSAYDGDLAYSPDLALLFNCLRNHPFQTWAGRNDRGYRYAIDANDFVTTLRREGERINVKRKIKDWRRNVQKNQKRLNDYLDYLFDRYARLMVVRLDLIYHKAAWDEAKEEQVLIRRIKLLDDFVSGKDQSPTDEMEVLVSLREVRQDWLHFHDNMRSKPALFQHLVGHAVRFEFASVAGYHIHAALFFDGSKVQHDEWLAEEIGKYWIKTTQGRGYFFNCNRQKYKRTALGLIDYYDEHKRDDLSFALDYLVKDDQFVRAKTSPKAKLFLTGKISPKAKGWGRPRSHGTLPRSKSIEEEATA
ncbi:MAG: inovirus Gp2 family protein [Azoarcus sp.]|jgi:hypothetical protein|nr:inovirus Gp2 family protein [Azoarcus sp.]